MSDGRIAGFVLHHLLAVGGSAEVWAAHGVRPPLHDLALVLKLRRADGDDEAGRTRFLDQARLVARLDHPRVLPVLAWGRVGAGDDPRWTAGTPWVAMPRAGRGLDEVTPTGWRSVESWLLQALDALGHAHARGVLHGDLKPANLLVGPDGGVLLADFSALPGDPVHATPGFAAPEQVPGGVVDARTDVFGVGALAWALVAGSPPGRAPFAPRFAVPRGLERWLDVALAVDPDDRFACAADAAAALEAPAEARPRRAPMPRRGRRRRHGGHRHASSSASLVGRADAQDRLWEVLRQVERVGGARVVEVLGPPGIGTSALTRWLAERALETGAAWVHEGGADDAGGASVAARVAQVLGRDDGRTVVIRLDDLRWSERGSAVAVACLRRALADDRPLVVLRAASEADPGLGLFPPEIPREVLRLGPLEEGAMADLLHTGLGLSRALVARVRQRFGGVPGAAVHAVARWQAEGQLVAASHGLEAVADAALEVGERTPWSSLWHAERSRLDVGELEAVTVAALMGTIVPREAWQRSLALLGLPVPSRAIEGLAERGLVWSPGSLSEGWAFAGPGLRAVVAGSVGPERCNELRLACARGVAVGAWEARGLQLLAAGHGAEAAEDLRRAVAARIDRADPFAASDLLAREREALAMAEVPSDDLRWGLARLDEGRIHFMTRDLAGLDRLAEGLVADGLAHGWQALVPRALCQRAWAASLGGDRGRAEALLEEAERRGQGDAAFLAGLARQRGWLSVEQGALVEAEASFRASRALARGRSSVRLERACELALAYVALCRGDTAVAGAGFHDAADAARRDGDQGLAVALDGLGLVARLEGRLGDAERFHAEALRLSAIAGLHSALRSRQRLAVVWGMRGRLDQADVALEWCRRALDDMGLERAAALCRVGRLPTLASGAHWRAWDAELDEVERVQRRFDAVSWEVGEAAERAGDGAWSAGEAGRARRAWGLALHQWQRLSRTVDANRVQGRLG